MTVFAFYRKCMEFEILYNNSWVSESLYMALNNAQSFLTLIT